MREIKEYINNGITQTLKELDFCNFMLDVYEMTIHYRENELNCKIEELTDDFSIKLLKEYNNFVSIAVDNGSNLSNLRKILKAVQAMEDELQWNM